MIWSRWWVLASDGWSRWPHAAEQVFNGLQAGLVRAGWPSGGTTPVEVALLGLESLDVEDDGSPEWQYLIDLAASLNDALRGADPAVAVESTIRAYLEGTFNVLANTIATRSDRSVSQAMAEAEISASAEWKEALALTMTL